MKSWRPGDSAWFEYHCWESDHSSDAPLWHHSHQKVIVVSLASQADADLPNTYIVQFADGMTGSVFEDELLTDPAHYERPDPPR